MVCRSRRFRGPAPGPGLGGRGLRPGRTVVCYRRQSWSLGL